VNRIRAFRYPGDSRNLRHLTNTHEDSISAEAACAPTTTTRRAAESPDHVVRGFYLNPPGGVNSLAVSAARQLCLSGTDVPLRGRARGIHELVSQQLAYIDDETGGRHKLVFRVEDTTLYPEIFASQAPDQDGLTNVVFQHAAPS
jgi:hypothetical protein